ncbi:hypothetical protein [Pseudomonas putida]|uniref:hypothetical protein n=1 Tax=Pseudomonas putida TaxID=303 RepID=UPI00300F61E2
MTEPTFTFKCLGHTKRDDGTITSYTIKVTSSRNDHVEVLDVEPRHLISAKAMKTRLLHRCMFYSTTQKKHTEAIDAMFDAQDAEAERRCQE